MNPAAHEESAMRRVLRILAVLATTLALPAAAHESGALHLHATALLVPLLLAFACAGLVAAAAPRLQRRRVRVERREPRP